MDIAHNETDKIIAKTEKLIAKEYKKAHKEVSKKMDDYLARFATKDEKWQEWVASGKKTEAEYKEWKKGQVLIGKRWEEMKNVLAADYANAAQISESIVNGYKPEVYAINHNYATFEVEKGSLMNTSYTLYSRESVERMYRENPRLYHQPGDKIKQAIKNGTQAAWDKRRIQSVLMQGIVQGESIPNLTQRLEHVTKGDHNAAIRNARTMMTGVQNAGRLDAFARANALGIPTKKQWMATLDSRTRHWHRQLDGMTEEYDKPFIHAVPGNTHAEIMFPGDPNALPVDLYNCRCTLIAAIKGFEHDLSDTSLRYDENLKDMDYDTWKATKESESHPITKQEKIGQAMKQAWWNEYAGHGGAQAPTHHKHTAKEGQAIIDQYDQEIQNQLQQELDDLANMEYSDIWQNKTVTPADYQDMDTQIYVKHQYLDKKIAEAQAKGNTNALAKYQAQKDSLLDFEQKGKEYNKLDLKLHPEKEAQQEAEKLAKKASKPKKAKNVSTEPQKAPTAKKTTVSTGVSTTPEPPKAPKVPTTEKEADDIIKAVQKDMDDLKKKSYDNIWQDPVSPSDYAEKKDKIAGKKQYFQDKLSEAKQNGWTDKETKFTKLLDDLDDFEEKGKAYEKAKTEMEKAQKLKDELELKSKPKLKKQLKEMEKDTHDVGAIIGKENVANYEKIETDIKETIKAAKDDLEYAKKMGFKTMQKETEEELKKLEEFQKAGEEYKKTKAKLEAIEQKQKQIKAKANAAKAQKEIDELTKNKYDLSSVSSSLKNIDTVEDYEQYKSKINSLKKAKKDWMGWYDGKDDAEYQKFKEQYEKLLEYEKDGKAYLKNKKLVDKAMNADKTVAKTITANDKIFTADAYSDARRKAAKNFSSRSAADKWHRPWLDKHWDDLDEYQKFSVWKYTENSNPLNKSLSGYHDDWYRSSFLGPGKTDWGHEDSWRRLDTKAFQKKFAKAGTTDNIDHHKVITELTKAIEKTPLQDDAWFVRGSDNNGLAGIFEGDLFSFEDAKRILETGSEKDLQNAFKNQVFQNHAFTSTGISSDAGFGGNVKYRIYAPKGTKAIYAEPQSYYGNTISGEKIYKKGASYRSVGGEAEVVFQRGTKYRVRDIKKNSWGDIQIELEVVDQPNYFKTGMEDTINNGATLHKK